MDIVLHQFWRSTASWRVRWALAVKGVPFTSVSLDIVRGEHLTAEHRARNPITHVPSLRIDGRTLAESVAIIEYLEETRPLPPLYPTDPWARARVRQLVEVVNSGIQPFQNLITRRRHADDEAAQQAFSCFFIERGLGAVEALLGQVAAEIPGDGRFAVGASLTAADIFLVPQVLTARRFGIDLSPFPRVVAVEQAVLQTEHARSALPENQPGAPAARG